MNTSRTTSDTSETPEPQGRLTCRPAFVTTHWSVVLAAGCSDTTRARDALARLCQTYWYPLYTYVRRRGYSPEDAEDLTQQFFARLLERKAMATVSPKKGKFRSFLLGAMNHFLADEWDKARAQKRGGCKIISLDTAAAEMRYNQEPAETLTPEKAYDRRWALTLLEEVYRQLQQEYERNGKGALFEELRFCLTGQRSTIAYADLAKRLGLSESAVKVAVHRLRQRYRKLLRHLIAETVSTPDEAEEELRYLLRALAGA